MAEMNILGRIDSLISSLPKAELKIASYILKHPEQIINMTASELGNESNSSAATVIRLCKRIGIPSFTQLKIIISSEVTRSEISGYSDITSNESIEDIMDKLLGNTFQSLQDTVSILDHKELYRSVDAFEKASVIFIFGVGASYLVAENLAQKFRRIGKTCIANPDPHNLIAALVGRHDNGLFIGISNSGETKEVIKLLNSAKDNNYTTISLTRFGSNSLSTDADISLKTVRANEEELRSAATYSLHAQFLVVDILFFAYASRNYKSVIERVRRSKKEIDLYNAK